MADKTTPCKRCKQPGEFDCPLIEDREPGKFCPDFKLDLQRDTTKTRERTRRV